MFKFIGLVTGLVAAGFFGAFIGFIIGSVIDTLIRGRVTVRSYRSSRDFTKTLLIFSAAVMKADDKATKSELQYIRDFFIRNMGPAQAQEALLQLKEILNEEYDIPDVCNEFRNTSSYSERLLVMQFLFNLAIADNYIDPREISMIEQIASLIGISRFDYESIKAMFIGGYQNTYSSYSSSSSFSSPSNYSNLDLDYKILEVSPDATDAEIKKAYRELAKKHHPDKVNHLGDEMRNAAEEKFAKLNHAYERIKKARNFS